MIEERLGLKKPNESEKINHLVNPLKTQQNI